MSNLRDWGAVLDEGTVGNALKDFLASYLDDFFSRRPELVPRDMDRAAYIRRFEKVIQRAWQGADEVRFYTDRGWRRVHPHEALRIVGLPGLAKHWYLSRYLGSQSGI
jgi:hypothetical protein